VSSEVGYFSSGKFEFGCYPGYADNLKVLILSFFTFLHHFLFFAGINEMNTGAINKEMSKKMKRPQELDPTALP